MSAVRVDEPLAGGPDGTGGPFDVAAVDPAPRRLLALALAAGALLDVGLRAETANVVVSAGLVVLVVALLTDGRLPSRAARRLAWAALAPALFLSVRTSPWLVTSNLAAVAALLTLAITYARTGSVLDTTPGRILRRGGFALARAFSGPLVIRQALPPLTSSNARSLVAVGRAALIAVPFLAVVVILLAAGDAVFASLLLPDVDATPVASHGLTIAGLTLLVLGSVVAASARPTEPVRTGRFGTTEIVTMLALALAVLALFVISQLVALTDAGRRLVEEAGLTPAEYARSGFFQLSWATAFLVVFLALVRALARPDVLRCRGVRVLGAAVPLLATGLAVVSLRRMALYDAAFGLTMLRLWVVGAAVWMGAVLLLIAVRNAGLTGRRDWVLAGATAAALSLVLAADVLNAEAFVARHNIGRVDGGASLDIVYLRSLSDDAVPAIARARDRTREPLLRNALAGALRCGDERTGVAGLNLAAARANDARRNRCAP